MTRSLIAIFTMLLIAFGAQWAYAQPGRGMGMDPEQQIKELIAQLDVTSEQEPAFRAAMQKVNEMRMEGMSGMRGMRQEQGQGGAPAHPEHNAAPGDQANAMPEDSARGMEMMMKRRAEMEAKTQEILASVLSSAQQEKFKELEAARMQEMMSRMRH